MQPDLSDLDSFLDDRGAGGYLVYADSEDSTQRYLSGFDAPDPFLTLYDGEVHLLVSSLEYGRARKADRPATVARHADYDYRAKLEEYGHDEAGDRITAEFLAEHGVESVVTPEEFPLGVGDGLRAQGVDLEAEREGVVDDIRAVKTSEEVEHVAEAQTANERAMARAEELIAEARVETGTDAGSGVLVHEGEVLTSERVTREIEMELLRHGCALDETIVACGADAADPHDRGSGPLRADESIIVDIFPRDKETKYFADMTRTFVKGTPNDTVAEWYDLTQEAKEAAFDALEPGATGKDVHDAVCDVYEDAGWPTLRSDEATETGFIHSTGHGVGLDIHEGPSLSPRGGELEPGHVVTVEPGLYDPEFGGVRIEDIAVVTEDGYENFTDYPEELVVE
ncbi:M24 family metallopeptidase [Halomarina oriensis]|uniref:M24 family metallopeptidase n=1 Tax=Halomarina oriensis TaxID=671145 RepID=A0A6B0GP93_9EURY|nr:Xaa-Pro peptidase family protein [Halomarina oriensis]MWG33965.1 M24 family metallopeptidase [Halomarina oriensis]